MTNLHYKLLQCKNNKIELRKIYHKEPNHILARIQLIQNNEKKKYFGLAENCKFYFDWLASQFAFLYVLNKI